MIRELYVAGIVIPEVRDVWLDEEEDEDGNSNWLSCAFEVPRAKLQNLLWCAITSDFGSSL